MPVTSAILRKLAGLIITMVVASFAVFSMLTLAPGDPVNLLSAGRPLSPERIAELHRQYHLDDPFLVRYVLWLKDAATGEFGTSIIHGEKVANMVGSRVLNTLLLMTYASLIILVVGVGVGVLIGLSSGRFASLAQALTTVGVAVPAFIVAMVLVAIFSVRLGWFPAIGAGEGFWNQLYHLTLPAIALATAQLAYVARITQVAVRSEAGREHVDTARSKGIAFPVIVRRHILRNAMVPLLTVSGLTVASLIAGVIVIETAFSITDGVGSLLVTAVNEKDFPVVQAVTLLLIAVIVIMNAAIDLMFPLLDPRLRGRR